MSIQENPIEGALIIITLYQAKGVKGWLENQELSIKAAYFM